MKRVKEWFKRAFFGGKKELSSLADGEMAIERPSKRALKAFFRRKGAVVALAVLTAIFLFSFLAPLFVKLDVNYTDPLQRNVAPGYSLRAVPKKLKKEVKDINGFADFTVGLSSEGEVFVWGNTKDRLRNADLKKIPATVKREGASFVAAGKDHIVAITKGGEIVGWGDDSCGQYGYTPRLNAISMPESLQNGVPVDGVKALRCGYQATALLMKNGGLFVWGNVNAVRNLAAIEGLQGVEDIVFTNAAAVALTKEGAISTGGEEYFHACVSSENGRQADFSSYAAGRRAVKIAADDKCIALLTAEGELIVAGAFENDEDALPTLREGEVFTDVVAGRRHFVGVTNLGRAYAWGHNAYGQCSIRKRVGEGGKIFCGSLQTYLVSGKGKLIDGAGLKGYLMGTDGRGRDVFARIAHGGKTTMTVGGVAVLVSSAIALLVGCIAGYFGGWVDTLLMRITEIFSAVPFLPFAMLLSQIIKNYSLTEGTRIFIIMLILGLLSWTGLARMIRGQVLAEREKEFVTAARAMGVKEGKIAFRHVLPNILSVVLVSMTLDFASCLLTESSLSYLGFGVQQPKPTWGNMLSGSNNSVIIQNYWWQWLFPALFLSVAVVCINVVGDALRDALDPKSDAEKTR